MQRGRLSTLAIHLAVAGGRRSIVRLLLMGVGPAVGVTALLGALTLYSGMAAKDAKLANRHGQVDTGGFRPGVTDVTLRWELETTFHHRPVYILALERLGKGPAPPGVLDVPATGSVLVSPALANVLNGSDGALLRPRVPGTVSAMITQEGLLSPNELVAYVGVTPEPDLVSPAYRLRRAEALVTTEFIGRSTDRLGLTIVFALVLLGLLVPILVLVVTTARLSAASRQARFAAIRLIGASRSELRFLLGFESGIVALAGCFIGIGVFAVLRLLLLSTDSVRSHWFPADLQFPMAAAGVALLLVPGIAALVSMVGVRRVTASPAATVRLAPARRRSRGWPFALASGLVLLGACAAFAGVIRGLPAPIPGLLIGGGLALTLLGLAGTALWLTSWVGKNMAQRAGWVSGLIAGRRLEAAPGSATRAVASIAVFLGIVIVLQGIGELAVSRGDTLPTVFRLKRSDVVVHEAPSAFHALRPIPGVQAVDQPGVTESGTPCHKGFPCVAIVHTDGRSATFEQIRNVVGWNGTVRTPGEWDSLESEDKLPAILRVLSFTVLLILFVTGASLLVNIVDGILERRPSFAALSACGAPIGILWRSMWAEIAIPVALAVGLGSGVGVLVLTLLSFIANDPIPVPLRSVVMNALFAGIVTASVIAIAMPWMRGARKPDYLRTG